MKNLLASAALLALIASASADIVIETKVESPQLNTTTTTKIKGGKVRTDLTGPMGAMSSIMDTASGTAIQLMHGPKMAMKTTAEQMKQALEMARKAKGLPAEGDKTAKPVATGQKEKIGEYECEIYTWSSGGVESRYWIALNHPQAKLLKESEQVFKNSALGAAAGGPDMSALPGPALKTEMTAGGVKTISTIVSVKEANVEPTEFDVPKDYQDMSAALGGAGKVPAEK